MHGITERIKILLEANKSGRGHGTIIDLWILFYFFFGLIVVVIFINTEKHGLIVIC